MNKDIVLGFFSNHDTRKTETGRQRQRAESEQRTWRVHNSADKRARPKPEEEMKTIAVHNPDNLKTAPYTDFIELQGDLKTLPPENLEKLKQSIITYGIRFPAFIWLSESKKYIVDAHQRKKAFVALEAEGYIVSEVPYTLIHAANKKEAAELLLQANSRYGVVNEATTFFDDFDIDLSFINDIEILELDFKLEEFETQEIIEDEVPDVPGEPLTKRGELWLCGKNHVLCGDSTSKEDIERLMSGEKADMVFTDPPYNVNYDQTRRRNLHGTTQNAFKKIQSDNMSEESFNEFLTQALYNPDIIKNGCIYYVCMGTSSICLLNDILQKHNFYFADFIVWNKPNFTLMRNGYQRQYELLWYGWVGSPALHQIEDRTQSNLWTIGISQDFKDKDLGEKWMQGYEHPNQKPIEVPARAIKNSSNDNDIIIDFFLGSGTTLIACEQLNRTCYGMEIEPRYIDVILDRWAKLTGEEPLREDGITWSELKTENGI